MKLFIKKYILWSVETFQKLLGTYQIRKDYEQIRQVVTAIQYIGETSKNDDLKNGIDILNDLLTSNKNLLLDLNKSNLRNVESKENLFQYSNTNQVIQENILKTLQKLLSLNYATTLNRDERFITVGFVIHEPSLIDNFYPIWEALKKRPEFKLRIFIIKNKSSKNSDDNFASTFSIIQKLNQKKFQFFCFDELNELFVLLHSLNLNYLFLQTPYCEQRPSDIKIERLSKVTKVCYIPYGFMLAPAEHLQYELPFYKYCYFIFLESKSRLEKFKLQFDQSVPKLIVSGLPKMDIYRHSDNSNMDLKWKNPEFKFKIIWTPHWTIKWQLDGQHKGGYSQFLRYHQLFNNLAQKHRDIDFLIIPHPLLFSNLLNTNTWTPEDLGNYKNSVQELPNVQILENGNYLNHFKTSDCLFCDSVSFLAEYLPTKKPIVYLENTNGPGLNAIGQKLIENFYIVKNEVEFLVAFNNLAINKADQKKEIRLKNLEKFVYIPDAGIGNLIVDQLCMDYDENF